MNNKNFFNLFANNHILVHAEQSVNCIVMWDRKENLYIYNLSNTNKALVFSQLMIIPKDFNHAQKLAKEFIHVEMDYLRRVQ